jgi:hypothetical protein
MRILRALTVALLLLAAPPAVFAQDAPPTPPHAFLGEVTIDGQPAPVGTTIEARGEGVRTGIPGNPITITEAGRYGGPSPAEEKLIVQGRVADGAALTFYVNGRPAQCALPGGAWQDAFPFQALAVTPLNLRVGEAPAGQPTPPPPAASSPQPYAPQASPTAEAVDAQGQPALPTRPPTDTPAPPTATGSPPSAPSPTPLPEAVLSTPAGAPLQAPPPATARAHPQPVAPTPAPLPTDAPPTPTVAAAPRASPTPLLQRRPAAPAPTPAPDTAAETRTAPVLPLVGGAGLVVAATAGLWWVLRRR